MKRKNCDLFIKEGEYRKLYYGYRGSQKKHIYMLRAQKELDAMKIANDDLVDIQLYSAKSDSLIDFFTCSLYPNRYYGYGSVFQIQNVDYNTFHQEYLELNDSEKYQNAEIVLKGRTINTLIYNQDL